MIEPGRTECAGRIESTDDNTYNVLIEKLKGKRPLSIPRHRSKGNINMYLK
jgi:hypothetical protein